MEIVAAAIPKETTLANICRNDSSNPLSRQVCLKSATLRSLSKTMRLIHTKTRQLNEFLGDENVPPYAILSHTWGEDEVTYQDMLLPTAEQKAGYAKIKYTCEQGIKDGLEWAWVDTCCIDKSSSAELSEAINSMFRWYQKADVCYVYLSDISRDIILPNECSEIARSRWFTRGWTLQELIAPSDLIFYSKEWYRIGTKIEICEFLAKITGIDVETLQGQDLEYVSVAKRMCWASKRKTTRVEDIAYSLLGIFDINMPLLYGEGNKAFHRLQEEILKISGDHSLFAWGMPSATSQLKSMEQLDRDRFGQVQDQKERSSEHGNSNVEGLKRPLLRGLLADSPAEFSNSGNIVPVPWTVEGFVAPTMINRGIRVSLRFRILDNDIRKLGLPLRALPDMTRRAGGRGCAALQCCIEDDYDNQLGLLLRPLDIHSFGRHPEPILVSRKHSLLSTGSQSEKMQQILHIKPEKLFAPSILDGKIVIQALPSVNSGYILSGVHCQPPAHYNERNRVLNPNGVTSGALAALIFRKDEKPIFAIILGRISRNDDTIADCFLLQEEDSVADDYMTESELLDFMTTRYEPNHHGVRSFVRDGNRVRLRVSNTWQRSDWREGALAEFIRIEIGDQGLLSPLPIGGKVR